MFAKVKHAGKATVKDDLMVRKQSSGRKLDPTGKPHFQVQPADIAKPAGTLVRTVRPVAVVKQSLTTGHQG